MPWRFIVIKKINKKRFIFKWLGVLLAIIIFSLALLSWGEVYLYGWPNSTEIWALLIGNSIIFIMLVRLCYVNWNIEIYDHLMDKKQ